jgi:uncharacterized protein
MASMVADDLGAISQTLGLAVARVQAVVELLDAGNTVAFITRYRKDQTGGLDEEHIRGIQSRVVKLRLLAERKQTIVRSIESQGKLTPELADAIEAANTNRLLEDLYLPYKPKKQTLSTAARERGLEPLALEILRADASTNDLDARAADYVSTDRKVATAADALLGAGHILAELFSERADFRGKLRAVLERTGKLVSTAVEPEVKAPQIEAKESQPGANVPVIEAPAGANDANTRDIGAAEQSSPVAVDGTVTAMEPFPVVCQTDTVEAIEAETRAPAADDPPPAAIELTDAETAFSLVTELPCAVQSMVPVCQSTTAPDGSESLRPLESSTVTASFATDVVSAAPANAAAGKEARPARQERRKKEKKKKPARPENPEHKAFRDYFHYSEALAKVPPHRVLAINRGERAKALRVRIEFDMEAMLRHVDECLVPEAHPHVDFLRGCGRDALARLVLPSLEREVRRELSDRAELHAVEVFARNLRNLLLQPPIRDRRVLAIDPGFKSGCKLVALDEFGKLIDHGVAHIVGSEERRAAGSRRAVEMVRQHQLSVAAIGNGTACRETEKWISDLISGELADAGVAYVIVNEAGASVYSTSRLGREEFPEYDATLRGAISIGRRLQDPLSELVKIDAANIGVGMYQHDVKAKHLRESLDAVVASCVNFVGVDLNTASPALLRYVSGLNQLTAQRLYDHRTTFGPFKNREELKNIQGLGEATFVQAAGFLRICGGTNPLDATWIHPESYEAAEQVLARLEAKPEDLADKDLAARLSARAAHAPVEQLASEVHVGTLTLADIVAQLTRPGRDPRESLPPPIFKKGILKIDDLTPGMELAGTVLNVVDFGAFIDIGLKDSGLVHISQLANQYVDDPHQVVSVGDVVHVWVLEVDKDRRRVSLTMIKPGTRRAHEPRRGVAPAGAQDAQAAAGRQRPPRRPPAQRPPAQHPAAQSGRSSLADSNAGATGRAAGRNRGGRKSKIHQSAPPPKPKPVVPLTKAMQEGKAPLRTFGDLKQFLALRQEMATEEEETTGT